MLSISMATSIGLVAGCLSSWSLVPQLLRCWREGLTAAVSKKMFATRAFGLVLCIVSGFSPQPSGGHLQLHGPRSEHHDPSPHSTKLVTLQKLTSPRRERRRLD